MEQRTRGTGKNHRQQTETGLPSGEEWFRALIECTFDFVCELDAEGCCIDTGSKCWQMLGLTANEIAVRPIFDFIHPEDRDKFSAQFADVIAGTSGDLMEFRCLHRDGSWVWYEGVIRHIQSHALAQSSNMEQSIRSDKPTSHVALLARDIDKRKRYDSELSCLISLAKSINAQTDLRAITRELDIHLKTLLPFDLVFIALNDTQELVFISHTLSTPIRVARNEHPDHPAWQALERGKPWMVNESPVPQSILESTPELKPLVAGKDPVFAFIKVPLFVRDEIVGVLCFESFRTGVFTDDDIRLASMTGEQVAVAVHQVLLLEKALHAESKYRALVQDVDAIVWEADPQSLAFTFVSPQAKTRLGYPVDEWLKDSRFWTARIHPEDRARVLAARRQAVDDCRDFQLDYRVRTAAGQTLWLRDLGSVELQDQSDGSRKPVRVRGLMFDITERKHFELALMERNTILKAVQEAATDGICVMDTDGRAVSTNQRFIEMWPIPADLLQSLREKNQIMAWISSKVQDPSAFVERMSTLAEDGETETHDELRLKDKRLFECYSAPALTARGKLFGRVWSFRDITAREHFEQQLAHQAFHDPLTDLPNRALFLDRLEHALSRSARAGKGVGVLFLDLDRFKIINDSLGHSVGDELLVQVAERLQQSTRPADTPARFGGDEFTVLVEDILTSEDAVHVAMRVFEGMKAPFHLAGHEVHVSASIGIALSTSADDTPDELLRKADVAMYWSKSKGAGGFELFSAQMNEQSLDRLQLEIDLRQAVRRDQLRLCYQPLVHLESGRIIGAEALVRWQHPTRGLVQPDDFIPIAEEIGMILPIGRWVLRKACIQVRHWQREFPGHEAMQISINISVRQLEQSELADEISEILRETDLGAQSLGLEITESAVMKNVQANIDRLQAIRQLGVRLAIDDFGTGYSSLSYLEKFPLDALKIDRSFVKQVGSESTDKSKSAEMGRGSAGGDGLAILEAMSNLGHTLGVSVIAEGIETAEQRAQLRALSCEIGQGFYFSRPVTPEAIDALLLSNSRL